MAKRKKQVGDKIESHLSKAQEEKGHYKFDLDLEKSIPIFPVNPETGKPIYALDEPTNFNWDDIKGVSLSFDESL